MIDPWYYALTDSHREFRFCSDDTNILIEGTFNSEWVVSARIESLGSVYFGYNKLRSGFRGDWKSLLCLVIQQAINSSTLSEKRSVLIDILQKTIKDDM